MMKVCRAVPFFFGDHVLLSFSNDWIILFKTIPEFEVIIDNENKLHLISTHTIKNKSRVLDRLQLNMDVERDRKKKWRSDA